MRITETHETHISVETAEMLKKAGFEWPSYGVYNLFYTFEHLNDCFHQDYFNQSILAPTLSVVQKWLREEKDWIVWVEPEKITDTETSAPFNGITTNIWKVYIWHHNEGTSHYVRENYSYDEALEDGINKALEQLINEQDKIEGGN